MPDADAARDVRQVCRLEVTAAPQMGEGKGGDDGVPGTGHVEDLALVGNGDVHCPGHGLEEAHALGSACNEERLDPELRAQSRAGLLDLGLVLQRESRGLRRLLEVRGCGGDARIGEQPVAGVEADVASLRETY